MEVTQKVDGESALGKIVQSKDTEFASSTLQVRSAYLIV